MACTSLRLLRPFSSSRPLLFGALSPSIVHPAVPPHVLKDNPSALPSPSSWQQFCCLPCLPCRPLVDLQNLGSTGQHDRNAKEVSQPGIEPEPATSEWSLQCRRSHIHIRIHIPALNGTSALYGTPVLYGTSALYSTSTLYGTTCQIQRGEVREEPEASDRERHVTNAGDDVAKASFARATVESDVADVVKEESEVGGRERDVRESRRGTRNVRDDVSVSESDVADVTKIFLSLGCTRPQLKRILNKKNLVFIAKHGQHILRKAALFSRYGIDSKQFLDIVEKDTNPRQHFLSGQDEQHKSVLNYLQGSLKVNKLGKMIRGCPPLLGFLPSTVESKLLLWASLDVPITVCMLDKYPTLFGYSQKTIKEGIEEVKAIFSDTLGVSILLKFPMLAFITPQALQQRVKGIQELFGDDVAKRLLVKIPRILMAQNSTVRHTYKQLQQSFGDEKCLKVIQYSPNLLGLSWDSIHPKLEFLVKELGRTVEHVAAFPSVLGCSLEKRLKPRYDSLIKAEIESGEYSLYTLFNSTDNAFEDRFGVSIRCSRVDEEEDEGKGTGDQKQNLSLSIITS